MLGWKMLKTGDYFLEIPDLGDEEKQIILNAEERYKEETRNGEAVIGKLVKTTAEEMGIYLDIDQEEYLAMIAEMQVGYGFFDLLLADSQIEEISVLGPEKPVYVYLRNQGWKSVNACFENEKAIADMINKMARNIGRHITMQNPRIDAMLPDGSRLHGSLPPISQGEITIRKFRETPFSPIEIVKNRTTDIDSLVFLSLLMQCDASLVIAGNTASGKTTTMNALFSFVPANERVIITEETPEINIPHKHQMRMVANRDMGIALKDLVYDSLRMRPDRMIVGEVRNREEVEALFDVLLAGQARGSYATFHAQSIDEAVSRLKSFGIREMDIRSIDCMVIQRRMLAYDKKKRRNYETRKVVEIADMNGKKYNGDFNGELLGRISASFGMSRKELKEEMEFRKKIYQKAPTGFNEFFEHVQNRLYGGRK